MLFLFIMYLICSFLYLFYLRFVSIISLYCCVSSLSLLCRVSVSLSYYRSIPVSFVMWNFIEKISCPLLSLFFYLSVSLFCLFYLFLSLLCLCDRFLFHFFSGNILLRLWYLVPLMCLSCVLCVNFLFLFVSLLPLSPLFYLLCVFFLSFCISLFCSFVSFTAFVSVIVFYLVFYSGNCLFLLPLFLMSLCPFYVSFCFFFALLSLSYISYIRYFFFTYFMYLSRLFRLSHSCFQI